MKSLSKYLNYLIAAVIASYGVFYFYHSKSSVSQQDSSSLKAPNKSVDVDGIVNKFMKETAAQTIHDQYASQAALKKQLGNSARVTPSNPQLEPEDVPIEKQIHQADQSDSPADMIRQKVFEKEMQLKTEQLDRKEYARQYIENARRGGYHLVLSEDLKVISVTPIRKPSQNDDSVDSFPAD